MTWLVSYYDKTGNVQEVGVRASNELLAKGVVQGREDCGKVIDAVRAAVTIEEDVEV